MIKLKSLFKAFDQIRLPFQAPPKTLHLVYHGLSPQKCWNFSCLWFSKFCGILVNLVRKSFKKKNFTPASCSRILETRYCFSWNCVQLDPFVFTQSLLMPRCAACGAIIIKTRLTDQRDGFKQSDVDFQIKRARFPTTTQKFHCFIFRESVFSSRWRSKNFNKIFSSLLLCSRGMFFFTVSEFTGLEWGWERKRACFAANGGKWKKLISNKAVGFISRAIFFPRLFVLFPFMLNKPIIKIKQKTCLFSPNINTSIFFPHECILNKTLNSSSQRLFLSQSQLFFASFRCNLFVKQKDARHEGNRRDSAISVWSQLCTHSSVSIKLFHSVTQTHQKHINFYPRSAEALYLLLCVQRHYFYDISGCGWELKRVKKLEPFGSSSENSSNCFKWNSNFIAAGTSKRSQSDGKLICWQSNSDALCKRQSYLNRVIKKFLFIWEAVGKHLIKRSFEEIFF